MQERVVPEIGMLRAMWRGLETGPRTTLAGHEGGNPGYRQGSSLRVTAPALDRHGESKGISRHWLEEALTDISDKHKPAARLALLTALAPYQVDNAAIQAFRESRPGDRALLGATAWAGLDRIVSMARIPVDKILYAIKKIR